MKIETKRIYYDYIYIYMYAKWNIKEREKRS